MDSVVEGEMALQERQPLLRGDALKTAGATPALLSHPIVLLLRAIGESLEAR